MATTDYGNNLSQFTKDIANGIRVAEGGTTGAIHPGDFKDRISALALEEWDNTRQIANANQILSGRQAYNQQRKLIKGTMPNRGAQTATLNPGESADINEGYHNGNGKITARSLVTSEETVILNKDTEWESGQIILSASNDGFTNVTIEYDADKTKTTYAVTENDAGQDYVDIAGYDRLKVDLVARAYPEFSITSNDTNDTISITASVDQTPGYFSEIGEKSVTQDFVLKQNGEYAEFQDSSGTVLIKTQAAAGALAAPSLSYDATKNALVAKSKVSRSGYLTTSATSAETTLSAIARAQTTVSASYEDESKFQISAVNDQKTGYVIEENSKDVAYAYVIGAADDAGNYVLKQENSSEILHQINAAAISSYGPELSVTSGYFAEESTVKVDEVDRAKTTITPSKASDGSYLRFTATNAQQTGWVTQDTTKNSDDVEVRVDVNIDTTNKQISAIVKNDINNLTITKKIVDMVEQAVPSVTVNSSTGVVTGSATQTAGYVSAGTKSGTLPLSTQAAAIITPGTSEKTAVAAGKYTLGAVKVAGDADLKAANIKKDVVIFGVTGTYDNSSTLGTFSAAPSTTEQTYVASSEGYDGFSEFTVEAMPAGAFGDTIIEISDSGEITATTEMVTAGYMSSEAYSTNSLQMTTKGATTYNPSTSTQTIAKGTYLTGDITIAACKDTKKITSTSATTVTGYRYAQVNDDDLVAGNIKKGVNILGVAGTYDPQPSTTTLTANPLWSSKTYTPTGYDGYRSVTINAIPDISIDINGAYVEATIQDANGVSSGSSLYMPNHINASNIAAGSTVFGVEGTYTSDATLDQAWKLLSGYTAYVNGEKITGSMPFFNSYDEDIYLDYGETYDFDWGCYDYSFTVHAPDPVSLSSKDFSVTSNGDYQIEPDSGTDGMSVVNLTVDVPIPDGYIQPSGTLNISANGVHEVTEYESVNVQVEKSTYVELSLDVNAMAVIVHSYGESTLYPGGADTYYNISDIYIQPYN